MVNENRMDERIKELPEWAQKHIASQDRDIVNLKKVLGKIYYYNESIVCEFAKLNVGAKNR
jgi:hemerythrin